jgi:hypothetical protein
MPNLACIPVFEAKFEGCDCRIWRNECQSGNFRVGFCAGYSNGFPCRSSQDGFTTGSFWL